MDYSKYYVQQKLLKTLTELDRMCTRGRRVSAWAMLFTLVSVCCSIAVIIRLLLKGG